LQAELERHSQEEARKKIACLATQHAEEIERLKEERTPDAGTAQKLGKPSLMHTQRPGV